MCGLFGYVVYMLNFVLGAYFRIDLVSVTIYTIINVRQCVFRGLDIRVFFCLPIYTNDNYLCLCTGICVKTGQVVFDNITCMNVFENIYTVRHKTINERVLMSIGVQSHSGDLLYHIINHQLPFTFAPQLSTRFYRPNYYFQNM